MLAEQWAPAVKKTLLEFIAPRLGAAAGDLVLRDGRIVAKADPAATVVATTPAVAGQFYAASTKPAAVRDVSSLVKQIGEAVGRTPAVAGSP